MRIVIDMQGAQTTGSRNRGIGRYTLSLAQAIARNCGSHQVLLAVNGRFPETVEPIRAAFDTLVPQGHIQMWQAPGPTLHANPENRWREEVGERLREAFIAHLRPDVVHLSSVFEGLGDDALTGISVLDGTLPTAVTLYDLIPLLHRDIYLTNTAVEFWYERKICSLRRAQLWLAISESSRQEGITKLSLPEEWVVNISTAADAMFHPVRICAGEAEAIRHKYNLIRPFVMYTGGIDYRKNIERLIKAYAKLHASVRSEYQLAIVCSATEEQINALKHMSERCGLAGHEVVLTGFISDADMVALYNLCAAFIFPSWHEGFGLPALEAMSCGAAVIGSNTSSLPELIGRGDALFNPYDEQEIAAKLYLVLTDETFREQLKRHGLEQAKKFSWDNSARRALKAFEQLHAHNPSKRVSRIVSLSRPHLAYLSPLPPEKSGIADYSAELLPELARHYNIDVIVPQPQVADSWIRANCPIRSVEWFDQSAHRFDRVLYHFGNSVYHQHMFRLLERHPGTVVLHDFFLSGILRHLEWHGHVPAAWTAGLYASHGYHAVKERFSAPNEMDVVWKYPANLAVLQQANGLIVHSEFSRALAGKWYGTEFDADWEIIPMLRAPVSVAERAAARTALHLSDEDFLVCAFGMVAPTKVNHRLLAAWLASPLAHDQRCRLAFVGENDGDVYGADLLGAIARRVASNRVKITGFVPPAIYRAYLAAADVAVQLRTLSRGESPASLLDSMNYGLPTIANAHGPIAELPDGCVLKLPDEFSDVQLEAALIQLWREPSLRQTFGERARMEIRKHHHPRIVADQYRDAIEGFASTGPQARRARLVQAIAELNAPSGDEREWVGVAHAIAVNQAPPGGLKQLLIDVSELIVHETESCTQRVMRRMLNEFLTSPPAGYRVEPVYVHDKGGYYYARNFIMKLLDCPEAIFSDAVVEVAHGDVFLSLNSDLKLITRDAGQFIEWRNFGVQTYFLLYDLLALKNPRWFPDGVSEHFLHGLETIAANADGAVCVHRCVADELIAWLTASPPVQRRPLKIGWFHLGADIDAGGSTRDGPRSIDKVLTQLRERPTVLMVGTIEPRKGYAQSLAAFELLWDRGKDTNLAIIGKQSQGVDGLITSLQQHPEAHRRLFWFENVTEDMKLKLYEAAAGTLIASEGERFSFSLLEAGRHDLPILARDLPIFREVAGEHASYFSGFSADSLAEALDAWLTALAENRAPSSDAIPCITWKDSVTQLTDVILKGRWHVQCARSAGTLRSHRD